MTAWVKLFKPEDCSEISGLPVGKWRRYISSEPDGHGLICGMGILMPGEEISHQHPEEEVFFVLQGCGEARWQIGGAVYSAPLNPGSAFYKTAHIAHSMRNTGDEPLIGIFSKV